MLAPVKQYDCYIANMGSAAAMTLPTSYNASAPGDSSPAGPGVPQQVLLPASLGCPSSADMLPDAGRAQRAVPLLCISSRGVPQHLAPLLTSLYCPECTSRDLYSAPQRKAALRVRQGRGQGHAENLVTLRAKVCTGPSNSALCEVLDSLLVLKGWGIMKSTSILGTHAVIPGISEG